MAEPIQKKRRQFCFYYARLCNITEAARRAGFDTDCAYEEGVKTLSMPRYRQLVKRLCSETPLSAKAQVRAGLERLAFGQSNDAAYLVCAEELPSPAQLARLDLYNVSELKRVKGGGVEVKFFDRQRALERLYELAAGADNAAAQRELFAAISGSDPDRKEDDDGGA